MRALSFAKMSDTDPSLPSVSAAFFCRHDFASGGAACSFVICAEIRRQLTGFNFQRCTLIFVWACRLLFSNVMAYVVVFWPAGRDKCFL